MANTAIPLTVLMVVAGCLAAGIAAEASGLDQRIEGFIPVEEASGLQATQATGQGGDGTIETLHLAVEPARAGSVDVADLAVATEDGQTLAVHLEPVRDQDGSLEEGILTESDLVRLTISLASPMEGSEERTLVLDTGATQTPITVTAPAAIEDGYTRMDVE